MRTKLSSRGHGWPRVTTTIARLVVAGRGTLWLVLAGRGTPGWFCWPWLAERVAEWEAAFTPESCWPRWPRMIIACHDWPQLAAIRPRGNADEGGTNLMINICASGFVFLHLFQQRGHGTRDHSGFFFGPLHGVCLCVQREVQRERVSVRTSEHASVRASGSLASVMLSCD